MDKKAAESLAIEALSFLAAEPERIGRFLALTGVAPAEIRQIARQPSFLAAVLGHLAEHQDLLREFAAHAGRRPEDVDNARAALAGPDWERDTA
jgi:hypothetical protein